MSRKYLTYEETKNQLTKELLEQLLLTKTYKEIAQEYNADKRIVSKIAQNDYGINKNNKVLGLVRNSGKVFFVTKEELVDLYINKKMSARQIGIIYNVKHGTIINKLKEYNVDIRQFNHKFYYNNRNYKNSKCIDTSGYYVITIDGKTIREHRYVMEQYLGRKLVNNETVHHIDFDKLNNDITNLYLFDNNQYHILYHYFIEHNEYIHPDKFLNKYQWIIDETCSYTFLFNLYINCKMSANAIHQYIINKYKYDLDRNTIVKMLKKYKIYNLINPTINQYDDRMCVKDINDMEQV